MAHLIEFEPRYHIVRLSMSGTVTNDLLAAALSAVANIIKVIGTDGIILDFSGIESFNVSIDFIVRYVQSSEAIARDKPRVIIAPQSVVYGVARAFQIHTEGAVNLLPVRTYAQAYELLKLDSPVFGYERWVAPLAA